VDVRQGWTCDKAGTKQISNARDTKKSGKIKGFWPPEWYTTVVHMALAMARPWKHPKTGIYRLRKRIPDDLRSLLGQARGKAEPWHARSQ
jgi:hypothetical protein